MLPAAAAAADSGAVQIRRVDDGRFPLVRVTAVVPAGSRPTLAEGGRRAGFVKARELGAAQAMVLAVDNSASMAGRPLREAKLAATAFLSRQHGAEDAGLVAFGHEALSLTPPSAGRSDVERALDALATDSQKGTALYDAVTLSVERLKKMTSGSRVLVLLTDGHDLGSRQLAEGGDRCRPGRERRRLRDLRRREHRREAPDCPRLGDRRQALRRHRREGSRRRVPLARARARPHVAALLPLRRPRGRCRTPDGPRRGSGVRDLTPDSGRRRKRGPRASLRRAKPDHGGRRRRPGCAVVRRGGRRRPPSPPFGRDHPPARAAPEPA